MNPRTTRVVLCALCSWMLLCVVTWRVPVSLHFYDPVIQLLALQQHQRGESPAWNVLRRVDPADLSKDRLETIGWWPPAIPALAGPLTAAGLSLGDALRLVVIVGGVLGTVGWALWWTRFSLPGPWLFALAALVPWLRPASAGFFRFSGDTLAFFAAPWVFLGLLSLAPRLAAGRGSFAGPGLAGVVLGLSCLVKYSLAVVMVAAFLSMGLIALSRSAAPRRTLARLAVLGLALLVVPLSLKAFSMIQGGSDPTGHVAPDNRTWSTALHVVANPALGLADASSPLSGLLSQFGFMNNLPAAGQLAWMGVPGGLLLLFLVFQNRPSAGRAPHETFALFTVPVFTALMIGLWFVSDAARDTRLFIPVTFAALPAVIVTGKDLVARSRPVLRATLLCAALAYIVLPLSYGPFFVAAKIIGARDVRTASPHVHLPSLKVSDEAALLAELAPFSSPRALWIVTDPEIALALPGRVITERSGRSIGEDLGHVYRPPADLSGWRTTEPLELLVLADASDSPPALPASIPGIRPWSAHSLADGCKTLWTARLDPLP
jgi:hypothetical protein